MRNPVLAIAIVFVLAAPCTTLAGEKKEKTIDVQSYSWGVSNAGSMSTGTGGRAVSPTTKAPIGGSIGPTKPTLPTTGGRRP